VTAKEVIFNGDCELQETYERQGETSARSDANGGYNTIGKPARKLFIWGTVAFGSFRSGFVSIEVTIERYRSRLRFWQP
jgi:hypothetical protein